MWSKIRMGLFKEVSAGLNAKLCDQSTPQLSTSQPKALPIAPHQWTRPNHGATKQLANPLNTSLPIPEEQKLRIQQIIGTFLYCACAVKCTMLPAINTLAEQQSSPNKKYGNCNYSFPRLCSHQSVRNYPILIYQYDTSH